MIPYEAHWQAGWDYTHDQVLALDHMNMVRTRAMYDHEQPVAWLLDPKWAYHHLLGKPTHVFGIPARIVPLPDNHMFYLLTI